MTEPGVIATYRSGRRQTGASPAYDELVDGAGQLREQWSAVAASLDAMSADDLTRRRDEAAQLLADDGVTYHPVAADRPPSARDGWALDPVPLLVAADDWRAIERGLVQRATLLDLVLADLYGERQLIRRGLLPPEVVYGHPGFLRECDGIRLPTARQLFTSATDVVRHTDGHWYVVDDRTQAPAGAGYALENRVVVPRVLPAVRRAARVQRLAPFFRTMRAAARAVAPAGTESPRIVVLTPGPLAETAFEHAFLAAQLGYPLVEGSDLRVRHGRAWLRSIHGLEQVDVILRRVDADYCDPLEFRPESRLGVPGLVEACRTGAVSVVNPLGSGVLENAGLLAHLPALAEALLGEPLLLPAAQTWWCGDDGSRQHVLGRLSELVVKPIARQSGAALHGWELSEVELDDLRRRIEARPHSWVGQSPLQPSTAPSVGGAGLEPREQTLRTFAVMREDTYAVLAGGLSQAAASARNGAATTKDVWVLAAEPERQTGYWLRSGPAVEAVEPAAATSARIAADLFWLGRYAERAEGTARLLRTAYGRFMEFDGPSASPAGVHCVQSLLAALDSVGTDPRPELVALLVDATREGTVAHAVHRLFEAAHAVRDQLSVDTFLVLGNLDGDLVELGKHDPESEFPIVLGEVLQRLLALSGLMAESMVRDPGWRLLDAGRRIERSLRLVVLLRHTLCVRRSDAADSLVIESVLGAAESIITYRRRYRSQAQIETVLDLLLLDAENPRSLAYQFDRLAADLRLLGASTSDPLQGAGRFLQQAAARLHVADTEELSTVSDERRLALETFLVRAEEDLLGLATALDASYFPHPRPARPLPAVWTGEAP